MVKENGQPQLSLEQFRRMMNIIYLEGVIYGLKKSKEANKGTDQFYKYDVIIFKEEQRLSDLTGNIKPKELLVLMLKK
ncbi:MAG: hypothetical protein KJO83_06450 [Bacteroidia bacterium]|nr:hypothetical protein [Bacteroidia bacterium]